MKDKPKASRPDPRKADPERLKGLAISESGFLFDPVTGHTYNLNPTAVGLLRRLQAGLTRAEILRRMTEEYEADANDLERDTDQFLSRLEEYGILVWKKPANGA